MIHFIFWLTPQCFYCYSQWQPHFPLVVPFRKNWCHWWTLLSNILRRIKLFILFLCITSFFMNIHRQYSMYTLRCVWCLGSWMNHLPPVWRSTFRVRFLVVGWYETLITWRGFFSLVSFLHSYFIHYPSFDYYLANSQYVVLTCYINVVLISNK